MKLKPTQTALAVGVFTGVMHAIWSAVVMLGLAQMYMDWILGLHFVNNPYRVQAFTWNKALMLVAITGVIGYAVGYIFAVVWNKLHQK